MEKKFTISEIKEYLSKQDSFGDAMYFLTAENIEKANAPVMCEDCDVEANKAIGIWVCPNCQEECYEDKIYFKL